MTEATLTVRPVEARDHDAWARVFREYRDFYRLEASEEVVERVWAWLLDDAHEVCGLVAEADDIVGIAHWRRFARPSTGSVGIWLDDLCTSQAVRGRGIGRALVERLGEIAAAQGCSVVRWITAEDNLRAQRLYDDIATRTSWVTYDATPAVPTD